MEFKSQIQNFVLAFKQEAINLVIGHTDIQLL